MRRLPFAIALATLVGCTAETSPGEIRTVRQAVDMAANTPPDVVDDTVEVDEDDSVTIDVLANDSDADGDALEAFLLDNPEEGLLTALGNGRFQYEPRADFFGTDSFTYFAVDGHGGDGEATVTIEVLGTNDPPRFVPPTPPDLGTLEVVANQTLQFAMAATDIDDDPLEFGYEPLQTRSDPPVVEDGTFRWTPNRFELGTTSVTIFVDDGTERDTRRLTIEVVEPADQECGSTLCSGTDVCFQGACFTSCQKSDECSEEDGCYDGRCAESACDGVSCEGGESCFAGGCFAPCSGDADCRPGERCWGDRCADAACEDIVCESGRVCVGGSCRFECESDDDCETGSCLGGGCASSPCDGVVCPAGQLCTAGECQPDCGGVACNCDAGECDDGPRFEEPSGCGCSSAPSYATGWLLLFSLFGLLRRRRSR
jgi:MYXO-CTERM domain-containing protein